MPDPPLPRLKLPPELLTFGATLAVVVATVMTLPAVAQTFPEKGSTEWQGPSGWQSRVWGAAFWLGVSSMVLAIVAIRRERPRRSRSGQFLAWSAAFIAAVGACVWFWPVFVLARNGF